MLDILIFKNKKYYKAYRGISNLRMNTSFSMGEKAIKRKERDIQLAKMERLLYFQKRQPCKQTWRKMMTANKKAFATFRARIRALSCISLLYLQHVNVLLCKLFLLLRKQILNSPTEMWGQVLNKILSRKGQKYVCSLATN